MAQKNAMNRDILSREGGSYKELQQRNTQPMKRERNASGSDENKITMIGVLSYLFLYLCAIGFIIQGSIHFNECPAQKMIPITFIVMGCLMLVSRLLCIPEDCRKFFKKESNSHFDPHSTFRHILNICRLCLIILVVLVSFCFFFALCYWIFHLHPDTKEGSPNYCEKALYMSTYYACIGGLAVFGPAIVFVCCRRWRAPVHVKSEDKGRVLEIEMFLQLT